MIYKKEKNNHENGYTMNDNELTVFKIVCVSVYYQVR